MTTPNSALESNLAMIEERLKELDETELRKTKTSNQDRITSSRPSIAQRRQFESDEEDESDSDNDDGEDEEDDDSESDVAGQLAFIDGAYNPNDYADLPVGPEFKELFKYITAIELETRLQPFIPDYVPDVGEVDPFIKIPRPDGKPDQLGLCVLDEPCADQSDPTILELHLRALAKQTEMREMLVSTVEPSEGSAKMIDNWIENISNLYKAKPPPNVHYTK